MLQCKRWIFSNKNYKAEIVVNVCAENTYNSRRGE